MAVVKVESKTYTVDSLYQWDKNQVLEIRGLSLAAIPEIHFTNVAMSRSIVRQATMDAAGIITVQVPNSLLQKPHPITVFVCTYEGSTFKTLYKLDVSVKARNMPSDYTLTDDPEVYSFNALENKVENALAELQEQYNSFLNDTKSISENAVNSAKASQKSANESAAAAKNAAESATAAKGAAAKAAKEAIEQAILKSDITEIVKVSETPENPEDNVLYIVV